MFEFWFVSLPLAIGRQLAGAWLAWADEIEIELDLEPLDLDAAALDLLA